MVRALEHAAQHENEDCQNARDEAGRAAACRRIGVLLDIHHLLDGDDACDCVRIVRGQPSGPERLS
jgi:hypothetical protein